MGGTGRMGNEELEVAALAVWGPKWSAVGPHAPPHQDLSLGLVFSRIAVLLSALESMLRLFPL